MLAGACGNDSSSSSGRAPLGSPPDPGPVPDDDGLDDATRQRVVASTARISGVACGRLSVGSAFAVADDLLATNAHVIVGVDEIRVDLPDGRTLTGQPAAFDAVADLALVRVDGAAFVPLPLGDAADDTVGALVGWEDDPRPDPTPFRIDRPVTVRIERVGASDRIERPSWLLAADVETGDSGGALVDADGTVVGIAYAATTRNAGVGYAVRATELQSLIAEGLPASVVVADC